MQWNTDACVVAIEVDGRQAYLFESDKLIEMLGSSRILQQTVEEARHLFTGSLRLFQPVSGEIRAWSEAAHKHDLLRGAWALGWWLTKRGVEHTAIYFETDRRHFLDSPVTEPLWDLDPWRAPPSPSLGWVQAAVTARVAARKAAKGGSDARPVCSLFAPCEIHGTDFANEWNPGSDPNELRRTLRGFRARAKADAWRSGKETFFDATFRDEVWRAIGEKAGSLPDVKRPIHFNDLADQRESSEAQDQYIGFLCADGDEIGRVLSRVNWNAPEWADDWKPWERNAAFAAQLDDCVRAAFQAAARHVVLEFALDDATIERLVTSETEQERRVDVPLLPQLLGGDDLWTLARKDVALELAWTFSEEFSDRVQRAEAVQKAVSIAGGNAPEDRPVLTMSLGVAFAKAGHPAHAQAEAAEWLLNASAKRLRKGELWGRGLRREIGCVDWHWIESSLGESVNEARAKGWMYSDTVAGGVMLLTTRPWTLEVCKEMAAIAKDFNDEAKLARRKREQLETILRLGRDLSLLAWESWWKGLRPAERDLLAGHVRTRLKNADICLDDLSTVPQAVSPWIKLGESFDADKRKLTYYATPFLDLLSLHDVYAGGAADGEAASIAEGVR